MSLPGWPSLADRSGGLPSRLTALWSGQPPFVLCFRPPAAACLWQQIDPQWPSLVTHGLLLRACWCQWAVPGDADCSCVWTRAKQSALSQYCAGEYVRDMAVLRPVKRPTVDKPSKMAGMGLASAKTGSRTRSGARHDPASLSTGAETRFGGSAVNGDADRSLTPGRRHGGHREVAVVRSLAICIRNTSMDLGTAGSRGLGLGVLFLRPYPARPQRVCRALIRHSRPISGFPMSHADASLARPRHFRWQRLAVQYGLAKFKAGPACLVRSAGAGRFTD